jgi:hypothetical protein
VERSIGRVESDVAERALMVGDLSQLTSEQRAQYYARVCQSLGLNPYTRPFEYLTINGKLTLYARRDATDQLRRLHGISTEVVSREQVGELYVVRVRATMPDGRSDEAIGAVNVAGAQGEALANALMKSETKAKRRATLSIVGLGWLDESEVSGLAQAPKVRIEAKPALGDGRRSANPLWKQHDALLAACRKAGLEVQPTSQEDELRAWIEEHRKALNVGSSLRRAG